MNETLSILIIDDSLDTVESTAELLRLTGCNVSVAQSGEEGLRIAAAEQPDVILLDIRMPGLDGYEVARRLSSKSTQKKPPLLIAVTGCGTDEDRINSAQSGFHLHLVKPVDPGVLIGMVRRIQRALIPEPRSDSCYSVKTSPIDEKVIIGQ